MKVGIINSQTNTTQKSQYNIKYRQAPSAIAFCAVTSVNSQHRILKTIRQLFNVISKERVTPKLKTVLLSEQEIKTLAAKLKSDDANVQNLAIKKIFRAYSVSKSEYSPISKFVWEEMVPYVKEQGDKNLTNLVLKIHKKVIPLTDSSIIIDRIKLIEAIGNKRNKEHIKEIASYAGSQKGVPSVVRDDDDFSGNSIQCAAYGALSNMYKPIKIQ